MPEPETSLQAKMTKLKLSYFGPIMRKQGPLEKTVMLGKIEGGGKGRSNRRWTDSIKEATGVSLQEPSRAVEDRTLWTSLTHRVVGSQSRLNDM